MDLIVRGARQHNLKSIDVTIPRDKLVVITGPSGSGKSSLAFDTIYAEGQRRYVESLSAYARQFLDNMPKPDVDTIEGLSPAISIEQQTTSRNPRSTVGTVTEIYDYLRLLFARAGTPHCPNCGDAISAQTVQQMVDQVLALEAGTRFIVQAPVVRARKGEFKKELLNFRKEGFVRATVDGEVRDLGDEITLEKTRAHSIDVHIDRLAVKADVRQRLTESIELALKLADGLVRIELAKGEPWLLSERFACAKCGISIPEIEPRMFSFNNPAGACPKCNGLGEVHFFAPELIVPDATLSLDDGAIAPWRTGGGAYQNFMLNGLTAALKVKTDVPFGKLPAKMQDKILRGEGEGGFEGIIPGLERRSREYEKRRRESGGTDAQTFEFIEEVFHKYARTEMCDACHGARLRPEALAVKLSGRNIREVTGFSIRQAQDFFSSLKLGVREAQVAARVVKEVTARLSFLINVGLDYLSLDRAAATLSGGEAERIRLATQIGAGLVGVLYVLDEPSIGLHPRDNDRLIATLRALRDLGNTVIVVEHDTETILAADHVIDMGPKAGKHGGYVTATGSPAQIQKNKDSLTGQYLSGKRGIAIPRTRRKPRAEGVRVYDATAHNLKDVDVTFPLGVFTCVTGVSGSGKSSLVIDTLLQAARTEINGARQETLAGKVEGLSTIDKVISIDQGPIGRSPRSNPATYTGVFTIIRDLFAGLPEARARGYKPGRFSFNVKGGRCEACEGDGVLRIEMHFLPDVFVQCEECRGRRYNRETLEVLYRGQSIADLLAMPIDEALELLQAVPKVRSVLTALSRVGLGYVELGQSATTLSGGEAQRVKLAKELARTATGNTLYVLDEPTTGLHFTDIEILINVLQALVDAGNSVIVIEHNLDVVKCADYVIDMGPEGGSGGGTLVASGTPEQVAKVKASHTGRYLARALNA